MDIQALWERALKRTEILRMRLQDLATFEATAVPYVFLAESALNQGDTVVRKGQVLIEHPSIVLPTLSPRFEGFEFEPEWHLGENALTTFLLMRGIQFPSLKYRHQLSSLDVVERSLKEAVQEFKTQLTMSEDITTGLVLGPEDAWQFSILILVGALVVRSAPGDLRRIFDAWKKRPQP